MHRNLTPFVVGVSSLFLLSSLAGCGGPKEAAAEGTSKAAEASGDKGAKKEGAANGGSSVKTAKLDKLNLKLDVESTEDPMVSDGGDMGTMVSSGKATVTVALAKESDAKTIEKEKSDSDLFNPKNFKSEKLADGWYVTFDNTGSAGANYFLTMYRKVGGKEIRCTTMLSDDPARAEAIKMCKSIKA